MSGKRKHNIILIGFMGAGKTTVSKSLAKKSGFPIVDTDQLIEEKARLPIKLIFERRGEDAFRNLESTVCEALESCEKTIISTGGGILTRSGNLKHLRQAGLIFFLKTEFPTIKSRLENDTTRPLFQDPNKAAKLFRERESLYLNAADVILETDVYNEIQIAEKIWDIYNTQKK